MTEESRIHPLFVLLESSHSGCCRCTRKTWRLNSPWLTLEQVCWEQGDPLRMEGWMELHEGHPELRVMGTGSRVLP